jgi:hypothetical protein
MLFQRFYVFFNHCAILQIVKLWHLIGMPVYRIGKDVTKSQFGWFRKRSSRFGGLFTINYQLCKPQI